jgi:hypothetical protein
VFDSFEGMPEPSEIDRSHVPLQSEKVHTYEEGSWKGSLDEVRRNVARYGDASVCTFRKGYFDETMPDFDRPCSLVFLDVGLRSSAETCLRHLWPLLNEEGFCFTHDVKHMEIASLFFDNEWWRENVGVDAPGLVGGGNGIGLHPKPNGYGSLLGYTVKDPKVDAFEVVVEDGAEAYGMGAPTDD